MYKNDSSDFKAASIILWQLVFTSFALYVSLKGVGIHLGFLVKLLISWAINIFQWFVIHHDMAHDSFLIKNKIAKQIFWVHLTLPSLL